MAGYRHINDVDLAFREGRERITLQGRQLLRRCLNEALTQYDKEFLVAVNEGRIDEFEVDDLGALLLRAATKVLG